MQAIKLEPSSFQGYDIKRIALHGAKRHVEAISAFDAMLSKLDQATDERLRGAQLFHHQSDYQMLTI